jgi:hypothetical protein
MYEQDEMIIEATGRENLIVGPESNMYLLA